MNGSLQSNHWYRVAELRPFLRINTQIARHEYRGQIWHLLRDPVSGDNLRINEIGYLLIQRLDGQATLEQIYRELTPELTDDAPTQDEIIAMMSQLAQANLIQTDRQVDLRRLAAGERQRKKSLLLAQLNPLSFKVAVFNPTTVLARLEKFFNPLFTKQAFIAWCCLIVMALFIALSDASGLAADVMSHGASARFLIMIWLAYPLLKTVHEFAHGLAVRHFGGEVTEMGLRLLVLMPVPFVDASAATLLPNKYERATVAAAGIIAEVTLASLALIVWGFIEPGLVRDFLLAVVITGTTSTVLFNANPLMKFDGYFVLCDLSELPNLAPRANSLFIYQVKKQLLQLSKLRAPSLGPGEATWLLTYAVASWCYRLVVMLAIAGFLARIHWIAGLTVLTVALFTLLMRPLARAAHFLWLSPSLNGHRGAAVTVSSLLLGLLIILVAVPAPNTTVAQGVVWLPEHAKIRSEVDGHIGKILLNDGDPVTIGQPVMNLSNQELVLRTSQLQAELSALRTEYTNLLNSRSKNAELVADQLNHKQAELVQAQTKQQALTLRAQASGQFVLPGQADLTGAWVSAGQVIGYVLQAPSTTIRLALANADTTKVRTDTQQIHVKFAHRPDRQFAASLQTDVVAGSRTLPSSALAIRNGGQIPTDPSNPDHTLEQVFVLDVLIKDLPAAMAGGRALVRFKHTPQPLASQATRAVRHLFLRHIAS